MKLRLMNRKCLKINELLFWHSISTVQNNKQLKIFLLNKVTAKASSMLIINICTLCYMHWHKTKPCLGYFPISPWISAFLGTVSSLILLFVTNKALLSTMGPRLEDFIFVGYWCKFWFLLWNFDYSRNGQMSLLWIFIYGWSFLLQSNPVKLSYKIHN